MILLLALGGGLLCCAAFLVFGNIRIAAGLLFGQMLVIMWLYPAWQAWHHVHPAGRLSVFTTTHGLSGALFLIVAAVIGLVWVAGSWVTSLFRLPAGSLWLSFRLCSHIPLGIVILAAVTSYPAMLMPALGCWALRPVASTYLRFAVRHPLPASTELNPRWQMVLMGFSVFLLLFMALSGVLFPEGDLHQLQAEHLLSLHH